MKIRDAFRYIISRITLKSINVIIIIIGICWLILGIKFFISENSESDEALTALDYYTNAYIDIDSTSHIPFTITQTPNVEDSPSESTIAPQLEDYLATFAMESMKENEDVIGWIRIEGTPLDYPVVQTENNTYYLKRDVEKKRNDHGAIFLDYRCDPVSLTGINIIYGHHMKDGSMFAPLIKYKDETFFKNHTIIEFATLEQTYRWEIFSVFITDPSYDYLQTEFADNDQYLYCITKLQAKSLFKTNILLNDSDDILILSTCTYVYDDARFVIVARRMD